MLLVKQPGDVAESGAVLHYRDVGDYLTRREKLDLVASALPAGNDDVPALGALGWTAIQPNEHGDWINQRSESFGRHLAATGDDGPSIFRLRTRGLLTSRDAWNYNSSRAVVDANVSRMLDHYNVQVDAFASARPNLSGTLAQRAAVAKQIVDLDPRKFSWDRANFADIARGTKFGETDRLTMVASYRPFHRRWVEAGRRLNNTVYQLPRVFPTAVADNLVIGVLDKGSPAPFSALCSAVQPDDKLVGAGNAMQFFPRYVYEVDAGVEGDGAPGLFEVPEVPEAADGSGRRHNVTDHALGLYQTLDPAVERDDIFFYVYGILHSPDYRTAFAADLKKSLPRIQDS